MQKDVTIPVVDFDITIKELPAVDVDITIKELPAVDVDITIKELPAVDVDITIKELPAVDVDIIYIGEEIEVMTTLEIKKENYKSLVVISMYIC